MDAFLDLIMDKSNWVTGAVALGVFLTALTLMNGSTQGARLEKRMKAVANRRDELRRRSREAMATPGALRQADDGFKKRIVERLNLSKLLEDPQVADKMQQAGLRGPRPLTTFYFFRFASPFFLMALSFLYLQFINNFGMVPFQMLAVVMVFAAIGFYAPNIYISNRISKRRSSIMVGFPDALDLLLICVEAGMSIEAAITKVSQEIGGSSLELAEELSLLAAELSYLPERRLAYEGLARRANHPGVKAVTIAMIQAEQYGTPLGAALRVMAKENRDLRMSAAEKKAASLPAQLTVPMILFFLPVLFVVILGPAIMMISDNMG